MTKMRHLIKDAFSKNLFTMRFFGLFPFNSYKGLYKVYSYIIYFTFTVPVPVLSVAFLFLEENIELSTVTENMFLIAQIGMFIFKYLPFITGADKVKSTIYTLELPIFNAFTKKQEAIIDDSTQTCKKIFYLFLSSCWMALSCVSFTPYFMKLYKLPVDVWLPYDALANPFRFYTTYIIICLGLVNAATSSAAIDPLIAGLACQATAQIKILKSNLQCLGEDADEEISKSQNNTSDGLERELVKAQIIYAKITSCVNHHNAILDFIKQYEDTFSPVVFYQFMASMFVICLTAYELTIVEPLSFPFFTMLSYLICMLSEIFLYSYYGTVLYMESDSIITAIYMGKWYEYDLKSKKALIVLMENAKKPIVVTAGKVLDLSLVTFTTVLRRAYSLFAVLQNFKTN